MPADTVPQPLWLIVWRTVFLAISIRIRVELEVVWNQEPLNFAIVSFSVWQLKDELPNFQTQQVQVKKPSLPFVHHFRTCRAEWVWSLACRNVQQNVVCWPLTDTWAQWGHCEVTLLLSQNQLWCLTHREGSGRFFCSHPWVTAVPSMPYAILMQMML